MRFRPNGQGIAALEMLNIMERFPLAQFGHNSADALHAMIEAKKLAYADMYRYVGDPKFSQVPVQGMLSKEYAAQRAKLIDMAKANCDVLPGEPQLATSGDTTYLTVVDSDGNMVSLIQSNYSEFGSGLVADGTGFALQNRGGLFRLDPNSPDKLAGHKRPLHTIIPGFMSNGRAADRVRHHGRIQSGTSARAIRLQPRRFRNEYSGSFGGGALQQSNFCRLRRGSGGSHPARCS